MSYIIKHLCSRGQEQTKSLLRTLAAHALPDPSPVTRPLGVFEFLSRLDICFQQQAGIYEP